MQRHARRLQVRRQRRRWNRFPTRIRRGQQFLATRYQTTNSSLVALHGLLHDAPEAYMGDIVRQVKTFPIIHPKLKAIEERLQTAILTALDVPAITPAIAKLVHDADEIALAREARELKPIIGEHWQLREVPVMAQSIQLLHLSWKDAMEWYLEMFQSLRIDALMQLESVAP